MKAVIGLFVLLALAGCISDDDGLRTAQEAIATADPAAEDQLEAPLFLFAVAAQGRGAVEFYETYDSHGVGAAPFTFKLNLLGDSLLEGRAASWVVMYEDQFNGDVLMVHVAETLETRLTAMAGDDGHDHARANTPNRPTLPQPMDELAEAPCPVSPDLQKDSTVMAEQVAVLPEMQDFRNETGAATYTYLVFAEGSCFNNDIVHQMGFHPEESAAAFVEMNDRNDSLSFFVESPPAVVLLDEEAVFTSPLTAAADGGAEFSISFDVPRNDTANVFMGILENTAVSPGAEIHVFLESPNGERQSFATMQVGSAGGRQSYVPLTMGTWNVVFHTTSPEPLSEMTVLAQVLM